MEQLRERDPREVGAYRLNSPLWVTLFGVAPLTAVSAVAAVVMACTRPRAAGAVSPC
jgi:hypothetical protein